MSKRELIEPNLGRQALHPSRRNGPSRRARRRTLFAKDVKAKAKSASKRAKVTRATART
jgi:hypothetical protein